MNKDLLNNFKEIVDNVDVSVLFPSKSGNRLNIGSYSIRSSKNGYLVRSYKTNTIIAETYSKSAAIAIAKTLSKKQEHLSKILELDQVIRKHHTDCIFYKHTMRTTTNPIKYESTSFRYEISKHKTDEARNRINGYIL